MVLLETDHVVERDQELPGNEMQITKYYVCLIIVSLLFSLKYYVCLIIVSLLFSLKYYVCLIIVSLLFSFFIAFFILVHFSCFHSNEICIFQ